MRNHDYAMEKAVPLLMTGGFSVHLINLAHHIHFGQTGIKSVLLPTVDAVLAVWMTYCAVGLIFGHQHFFQRFDICAGWRRVAYWIVTVYVTVSLPGHFSFLIFGDTRYFDAFPWWFSPIIMAVYVLIIVYFQTLTEARSSELAPTTAGTSGVPLRGVNEVAS